MTFPKPNLVLIAGTALGLSHCLPYFGFVSAAARPSLSRVGDSPEAYTNWVAEHGRNYKRNQFLGKNDEFALHWSIVDDDNEIHMAVSVAASGWMAFGLSEVGGMKGADMFVYTAWDNEVLDMYSTDYTRPMEDACHDWKLKNATVIDETSNTTTAIMIVEVSRALNTGDTQDLAFFDDSSYGHASHRVIAAWGDQNEMTFHGKDDVALGIVKVFEEKKKDDPILLEGKASNNSAAAVVAVGNNDDGSTFTIEIRAPDDYVIPTNRTTYEDFCFSPEEIIETLGFDISVKSHFIGAHYLEGGNEEFVHHIVLYGSKDGEGCDQAFRPIWVWAPGDEDLMLPQNVGIPFGPDEMTGLKLEIHYNNPNMIEGKHNKSGGRLMFTTNLRENEAAPMILGDPLLGLYGQPIGKGWSEWDFYCSSSCTENYLSQEITVFRNLLHMHESGERMIFKQYNKDGVERQHEYVDNYDFTQAGVYFVPKPSFTISPGDSFDVVCYYNEEPFGDNRTFGLASYEEMCMAFLWYYPRIQSFPGICGPGADEMFPGCTGNHTYTKLEGEQDIGRTFGMSPKDDAICTREYEVTTQPPAASSFSEDKSFSSASNVNIMTFHRSALLMLGSFIYLRFLGLGLVLN